MIIVDVTKHLEDGKKPERCWECPFYIGRGYAPEKCVFKLENSDDACPLMVFDEGLIDNQYRYMGDNTILDTKINEKLHPCPYEGCEGVCPYYVYFDDYGFYCYESECCAMEEGK